MTSSRLAWRGSPHQWRLAVVAAAALVMPVVTGHAILVALAAPLLMLLALGRGRGEPKAAALEMELDTQRCYEGEPVQVTVRAVTDGPAHAMSAELVLPPLADRVEGSEPGELWPAGVAEQTWTFRPQRWGRHRVGIRLELLSAGRLRRTEIGAQCELIVYPRPIEAGTALVPSDLLTQLGEHVSRHSGDGLQFAGVRPYVAGDRIRRINWYVSNRYQRLHVNTFAPERSANLVVMVDTFSDTGPPGESSLDHSLRGATALIHSHLKIADRVAVVAVGGHLRWMRPESATRHYFRIAEALLDAAPLREAAPGLAINIPRTALPPGALVVLFSPLLEPGAIDVIWSLAGRGHPVVVVDVLGSRPVPPPGSPGGALALRLFDLDRQALAYRLSEHGVVMLRWDGSAVLRQKLGALTRMPLRGRTA